MSDTEPTTLLFVNGALMRGLALHANLGSSPFVAEARTAPHYRLHSIGGVHPGMYRVAEGELGASIAGELYAVNASQRAHILATEPPDLYLGPVQLDDGRWVEGVLFPEKLARSHLDITASGGWRAYVGLSAPEGTG